MRPLFAVYPPGGHFSRLPRPHLMMTRAAPPKNARRRGISSRRGRAKGLSCRRLYMWWPFADALPALVSEHEVDTTLLRELQAGWISVE